MSPERWSRIEQLYHSALELDSSRQNEYLVNACDGDDDLRHQVELLLGERTSPGNLLDQPVWDSARSLMGPVRPALTTGTHLGPYRIEAPIGSGGMGEIFLARDTRLHRTVAIKVLPPESVADPNRKNRLLQEARAASALNDPNIVALYDISSDKGIDFLVLEYVPGKTLKELVTPDGLPLQEVVHYGVQAADALAAAHRAGIVHRDIKPANLMVTPNSQLKILDFGVAKLIGPAQDAAEADPRTNVTAPGLILGTVSYMSPEQTRGDPVDPRSDIFSLGCVLYQAATGRLPFQGPSALSVMHEIATAEPPAPSSMRRDLPALFDRVIAKAIAKDKDQRYASSAEFAGALRGLQESWSGAAKRTVFRAWWAAIGVAAAAVLAFVVPGLRSGLLPRAGEAMVAVLPFEDLDPDPSRRYVSQGVTEDIITQLGRAGSSAFGVIAGPSVWRYRDRHPTPAQVRTDLKAGYVLTGTVRREAAAMRITARLTRTRDSVQVWADSFDGASDAALSLQEDVAIAVARAVGTQVAGAAPKSLEPRQTIDPETYDLYFRGRFYWNQRTEVSLRQAVEYFQQTISRAPGYAPAYAGLGDSYAALVYGCYMAPAEGFPKVRAALQRARELDPNAAEAFASEGYMNMYFDWDFAAASRNLEHAIALNPNYAPAYDWLGVLRTAMEDFPAASRALDQARQLDPASLPILTDIGFERHYSNHNKDAEAALRKVFALDPNFPLAHFWMGRVLNAEGDCADALSELGSLSSTPLRDWQPLIAGHGYASGACGQRNLAEQDLKRLEDAGKTRFVTSYGKALIYSGLGDREHTLLWIRKAIEERSHWMVWIRLDPRFRAFRSDSHFQEFVEAVFARRQSPL
jgi:serine/threonine protein kinase/tetratricopeptide (TPR) repeat protein